MIQLHTGPIDCACLIHGDGYSWDYVERLFNMLNRYLTPEVRLHVYTEPERPVPEPMIKHGLVDWGVGGPRRSWWYKLQLFDPTHHAGSLLYFDLDTVIVNNIDWIWNLPLNYFWAVKDFKYLWRETHQAINSSIMWWNTQNYGHVWQNFNKQNLNEIMKRYPGDQDYLTGVIDYKQLRFMDTDRVKSWRWQCLNGGFDFKRKTYKLPNNGTHIPENSSVLIFHGKPKPHACTDPIIQDRWR